MFGGRLFFLSSRPVTLISVVSPLFPDFHLYFRRLAFIFGFLPSHPKFCPHILLFPGRSVQPCSRAAVFPCSRVPVQPQVPWPSRAVVFSTAVFWAVAFSAAAFSAAWFSTMELFATRFSPAAFSAVAFSAGAFSPAAFSARGFSLPTFFAAVCIVPLPYAVHSDAGLDQRQCTDPFHGDLLVGVVGVLADEFDVILPFGLLDIFYGDVLFAVEVDR